MHAIVDVTTSSMTLLVGAPSIILQMLLLPLPECARSYDATFFAEHVSSHLGGFP